MLLLLSCLLFFTLTIQSNRSSLSSSVISFSLAFVNATPTQEELSRPRTNCRCLHRRPNPDRTLEVGRLSQKNPGNAVARAAGDLRSRQGNGSWSRRRGEEDHSVGRVDCRGGGRGGPLILPADPQPHTHYTPFPFTYTHLVKGDPFPDHAPEVCAQRNAEGDEFLLSGLARRGGSQFLWLLVRLTYSLGAKDKGESKINK